MNRWGIDRVRAAVAGRTSVFLVLAILPVVGTLVLSVYRGLEERKTDSLVLDVAAQRRLLYRQQMEEIVLASLGFETEYLRTRESIRTSIAVLSEGGRIPAGLGLGWIDAIPPAPSPEIEAGLAREAELLDAFARQADQFLDVEPGDESYSPRLRDLQERNRELEDHADRTVKLLTQHSRGRAESLARQQISLGVALFGLSAFLAWQCVRLGTLNRRIVSEVEERTRLEAARRELGRALEHAVEGIARLDEQGRFLSINPACARMLSRDLEEMEGASWLETVHPDDRGRAIQARERMLSAGMAEVELRAFRETGPPCHLSTSLVRADGADGVPGSYVFVKDISERKEAQEALASSNRALIQARLELEARVEARTAELSRANRDLETLLYVVSHDLKEPVRSIENFSRMVRDRYAEALDAKGQDLLARVGRAAERLRGLLEDISQLARAKQFAPPEESIDGGAVVRSVLERLEGRIRETGARVRIDGELPPLRAQPTWATEAVYNLVANALKFTTGGNSPDVEIAGVAGYAGGGLVVRDRGPGVKEELAERIFGLFQRGVGRDVEGTGAGLAIVRQVAERHGGWAWVRPREGGGSEFLVTFGPPREDAAA